MVVPALITPPFSKRHCKIRPLGTAVRVQAKQSPPGSNYIPPLLLSVSLNSHKINELLKLLGNKTPLLGNKTLLLGKKTPLLGNKTLLLGKKTPLLGNKTPLLGNKTPLLGNKTPLLGNKTPLLGNKTPLLGNKTPLLGNKTLPLGKKTPLLGNKTPFPGNQSLLWKPKTENRKPETIRLFTIFAMSVLLSFPSFSKTIPVCSSCECSTIKSALEEARNGDILLIKSGIYKEGNIIIEKEVELIGENYPVIDGEHKVEIITIHSRNVKIKGFQIQNVGSSFSKDMAAIKLERVKNCIVEDNKVLAGYFGIYLGYSQKCIVRNNYVEGAAISEFTSGNAIHLWNCRSITIENNHLTRHRDGIYLEFSDDCTIENNVSEKNIRYGLHFMFSDNDIYKHNVFSKNQAGVAVMYSHDITMTENEFSNNWGSTSYGLLLKEIKDSKIFKNKLSENTTGLYAEGCVRINIENNDFERNGWALKIAGNCDENNFTGNNFLSNTFELGTNAKNNMNRYEKNFWSKYSGYDLNKDGVGDVPHNPVDLFTYLVEQQPVSIILMRSLFIDLLNLSEKVNPMLTPTSFNDSEPLMKPVKW